MPQPARICVVGSANVDLTFRTRRLPRPGETLAGHALHLGTGGKGANQAVAAARLGAKVAFVASIGNDSFGAEAIARLQLEGIDTTFVRRDSARPTGTAAIFVDDNAENSIVIVPGANAGLSAGDVQDAAAAIRDSHLLLCQLETPLETTLEAFRLARAAGVRTVLTPAPVAELPDELLRFCDVCVPNRTEMELLVGRSMTFQSDAISAADELRARGVGNVVVTMGEQGAIAVDKEGATLIPAVKVDAVDTTGAGDAFTAALSVSLAEGFSLREAARRASVVAALTVTRIGTQTAFPSLRDVNWPSLA